MLPRLNIGVITHRTEASYFGTLLNGIHESLKKEDANMFVINTFMMYRFDSNLKRQSSFYPLASKNIDGWIILSQGADDEYLNMLFNSDKPVVLISHDPQKYNCDCIIQEDNHYGAETITQHLIDHGHTKIAYIGWSQLFDMNERFEGYKRALKKNGIPFDEKLVFDTEKDALIDSGKIAAASLLQSGSLFTAVFCANDFIALGAMETFKESGINIPGDVAIMGYDDVLYAKNCTPSLSSFHQNIKTIGYTGGETLINILRNNVPPNKIIHIKSELVLRESCGCNIKTEEDLTLENLKLKDSIIKCVEDMLFRNYGLGTELFSLDLEGIKKLMPQIVNNYSWLCLGLFSEDNPNNGQLTIEHMSNFNTEPIPSPASVCPIEEFPNISMVPDLYPLGPDDIIWVLPLSTMAKNWGVISYISPFNDTSTLYAYDISNTIFNLLGIALDREVASRESKNNLLVLQKTLDTLRETQEQLIQTEKMASLVGVVSGIAHEINTPIGVSLTAASFLEQSTNKVIEQFHTKKLGHKDFMGFLEECLETSKILMSNLQRSSGLVNRFKEIAVNRSNQNKVKINLKHFIDDIWTLLPPVLAKNNVSININCPHDLLILTYPEGLIQIITSLFENSIVHGFSEGNNGSINIDVTSNNNLLYIVYSDDGIGIEKSNLSKIFDPFFTTKRGLGRIGLGLNIVYNIVTQEFGGTINCESEIGNGTVFHITIPLIG
ncbi:substrate-binding domain-containing protein [Pseudobacteroides cellulosolvens]|uniref:histidine kinase n=1 Tax=Pseudobacteroides cellulosolvens ATCC 35603 = DSM 2933 TaxID=398512 RepID=A0A0L6JTY0_9FIRM|nr:substrate-binding domain-containing protein [Pseudobacteroides cellulosolvens]KNY28877.1 ATP-binding region ATPase domain protein [Pseudobacteroides cellulosolvens ATCC 35603 = DSM 2933]